MKQAVKNEIQILIKELNLDSNYTNWNQSNWNCISRYQKLSEEFII